MRKATAGDGGSSEVSRTQQKKGKEEALEKRVKELLANQKRLDLALNRISRERDAVSDGDDGGEWMGRERAVSR
eukprot:753801-Hanusia_phi.AAC.2